jgi:signal transduction histidine kinase
MLQTMLQQTLRYFIPSHVQGDSRSWDSQRGQLLVVSALVVIGLSVPFVLLYFVMGQFILGSVSLAAIVLGGIVLTVIKVKAQVSVAGTVLTYCMLAVTTLAIAFTGGISSLIMDVLYAPILFAILFTSNRSIALVSWLSALMLLGFMVCQFFGVEFPHLIASEKRTVLTVVLRLVMLFGVVLAFMYSDTVRATAYNLLQQERDSVQEKVHEATFILQAQQERIASINADLADQNAQLQAAIAEAEQAKRLQTEFLRNASHEVRTPITAIMGFTEIISDHLSADDAQGREFLQQIAFAGKNLLGIFTNILALSSLEAEAPELLLEPIRIGSLVQDLERDTRMLAEQKQAQERLPKRLDVAIELGSYADQIVVVDAHYTQEILRHLLSNSVKFTKEGEVRLSCMVLAVSPENTEVSAQENTQENTQENAQKNTGMQRVRFVVSDTGIGMSAAAQREVFTPFVQHDGSKTREYGGLGLGLAITKRLVDVLGGTITYESALGKGSTFVVELPCTT